MSCPNCGAEIGDMEPRSAELRGQAPGARCPGCGGLWVAQEVLRDGVAEFLERLGHEGAIVPLHERPLGRTDLRCPSCSALLFGVALRGVTALSCESCRHVFLKPAEIDLISQRVLLSARSPKGRQPLSRNPILQEILENAGRSGNAG